MKIEKRVVQLRTKEQYVVNLLIGGLWFTINQEKVGRLWRTELNGEIMVEINDLFTKTYGRNLAMRRLNEYWDYKLFESIKDWYTKNYPTDNLGLEINHKATFYGLFETIRKGRDVYYYLNVYDSLVRERLFTELSNRQNQSYSYVYDMWLENVK